MKKFTLVSFVALFSCLAFADGPQNDSKAVPDSEETSSQESPSKAKHHHHRRPPPPEAIEACKGRAAKMQCSFIGHNEVSVSGLCWSPKPSLPLACKPVDMNNPQADSE